MIKEQIDKYIKVALKKGWPALTTAPINLSVTDASEIYFQWRREQTAKAPKLSPRPVAQVAAAVTSNPPSYTPSILNRSAVKSFALEVSRAKRNGKFERVSTQFVKEIEATVEALIRDIGPTGSPADGQDIPRSVDFLNRKAIRPKVEEKLNDAIRKIIIRKVCSHPSMGKTLK